MAQAEQRLGAHKRRKLVGYGVGDFGLNIYWNTVSIWLVYWYTDVVGLLPKTAGYLFLAGTIWDAVSDPIVANRSQHVKSCYGTYRPFLLFGGAGLGASFMFLFWVPPAEGTTLIVCLGLAAILFRTSYTLVAIPYAAMSSRLTYSSVERTELSGIRMFFAFGGLLTVSVLAAPTARFFSGGEDYTSTGFLVVAVLGATLATAAILLCFTQTDELPIPATRIPPPADDTAARSSRNVVAQILANRALALLLVIIFLQSGANAALMLSMVFFIDANDALFAEKEVVLTAFAVATLIGAPFWTAVTRWVGKKRTWCSAASIVTVSGLSMLIAGPWIIHGVPAQLVVIGLCMSSFAVLLWSFIPDTVEFGQAKTGERSEGLVFGSVLVVQKLSGGAMGVVVTQVLQAIGYSAAVATQNAEVGRSLVVFLATFPALMLALSAIPVCFLPMNRHIHADIVGRLSGQP